MLSYREAYASRSPIIRKWWAQPTLHKKLHTYVEANAVGDEFGFFGRDLDRYGGWWNERGG